MMKVVLYALLVSICAPTIHAKTASDTGLFRGGSQRMVKIPKRTASIESIGKKSPQIPAYDSNEITDQNQAMAKSTEPTTEKENKVLPQELWTKVGVSVATYASFILSAAKTDAFSPLWFASIGGVLLGCFRTAFSLQRPTVVRPDLHEQVWWPALFAAHMFTLSSPFLLLGMLLKEASRDTLISKGLVIASTSSIFIASVVEVFGHFRDEWFYDTKSSAYNGLPNQIFSSCMMGGFGLLAAAINPSSTSISVAIGALLTNWLLRAVGLWKNNKVLDYGSLSLAAGWVAVAFIKRFQSYWSLLYFCQAFNIVRNGNRLLNGNFKQEIHILTSLCGWFSYLFPFGLSLHPQTRRAGIPTVLATCLLSIVAPDHAEQWIQQRYTTTKQQRGA